VHGSFRQLITGVAGLPDDAVVGGMGDDLPDDPVAGLVGVNDLLSIDVEDAGIAQVHPDPVDPFGWRIADPGRVSTARNVLDLPGSTWEKGYDRRPAVRVRSRTRVHSLAPFTFTAGPRDWHISISPHQFGDASRVAR